MIAHCSGKHLTPFSSIVVSAITVFVLGFGTNLGIATTICIARSMSIAFQSNPQAVMR